jgi:hypothetical protein
MAAGLGFKTFTTGEVLTAADVNGYLMQGVLVFASAAARNAAITSPQEGQFAFTKDTNGLWYYDGAAWVASGATGDIEGVTAGVGITGGGTSGTVTITNDMATTITAAGDIVVGTGSGTYDNLPIGTTAQVLTADTTVSPYKVKWATPATGTSGLTKILAATYTSVSNTGTTFDGVFTSTYDNYIILFQQLNSVTNSNVNFQFQLRNGGATTATQYAGSYTQGVTLTTTASASSFNLFNLTTNTSQQAAANMNFYRNTTNMNWTYQANCRGVSDNSIFGGGLQNTLTANGADGFILSTSAGTLSGTTTVYGVQK